MTWSEGAGSVESYGVARGERPICSRKSPCPCQRAQRRGDQRPVGRINFRNQSPLQRRGERVPFPGVLPFVVEQPCGWLARCRPRLPAQCRVDAQTSKCRWQPAGGDQLPAECRHSPCASVLRVAGTRREPDRCTFVGVRAGDCPQESL